MIRRIAPTVAASLTALVLLAVPALAGSSFTAGAEAPADEDHTLELTITEPESEDYGDTARVAVVAPTSFTVVGCQQELTWDCTADAGTGRVTFERTALGALGDDTVQFTVHTPLTNGTYRFSVTQADEAEEPNIVTSAPTVTVTGGEDPQPAEDDGDSTDDGGGTNDGTTGGDADSTDGGDTGDSSDDATTTDSGTTDDDGSGSTDTASDTSSDDDQDSTSGSGGSTTPRRTEGRSNGTRLEITPGEPATDPTVSDPDVADDPAIAPPSDGDEEQDADSEKARMTAIAGQADDDQDDDGRLPWQQLLGGALLVAGGAALAVHRWDLLGRVRGWNPLDRIRRWRRS